MTRTMFSRIFLGLCLLGGAMCAAGCSSDAAAERSPEASGALSMPLRTTVGTHSYRLTGSIDITRPDNWYYYSTLYLDPGSEVATVDLPTGDYNANLYYWDLERDDGSGVYQSVPAVLLSAYYQSFTILNGSTTTISFEFETAGTTVTVGSGTLNVDVKVSETPTFCTPLGSGCPVGSWCAPSELLGADVACLVSGPVQVGASCRSPSDCVANSSCIDLGEGPRCTELCLSADFGQPCASGGTCAAQGLDYGACSP